MHHHLIRLTREDDHGCRWIKNCEKEKKNRYYRKIRDARIENDRNPTAHPFSSDKSSISSSDTLGR
jgi:hypothetical protein